MPPPRRYSTALRDEQTALTRRRILEKALGSFTEHGYPGTTLAAVAAAAGVSVQTVYNVVGGKPALLKAVYDTTLAGDDSPVPMAERPVIRAAMEAADGRECLVRYAKAGRMLGERVLPLVTILFAQAATGDADLRAFVDTIEDERADRDRCHRAARGREVRPARRAGRRLTPPTCSGPSPRPTSPTGS